MRLRDLAGRRVVLWGAARETAAVIRAARRFDVDWNATVFDETPGGTDTVEGIAVTRGDLSILEDVEVIVRSPGVSRHRPELQAVLDSGVAVTTASNLWFAEGHEHVTAVTGTKGKSTTASIIARLFEAFGYDTRLAGNIGRPPIDFLGEPEPERWVLEMSSFQASDLKHSPDVGVLTSLTPEHLDWHGDYQTYVNDKLNLFAHNPDIVSVINGADSGALSVAGRLNGVVLVDERQYDLTSLRLAGAHNRQLAGTALAAVAASGAELDGKADLVAKTLATFEPLPHRLHPIATHNGVTYIDDGLATTPVATIAALEAFSEREVTLLAGGYDRGLAYDTLAKTVAAGDGRIKVVTMPDNGSRIAGLIREKSTDAVVREAESLEQAVEIAAEITPPGGLVLLSPGAASFGHFADYKARSDAYAAAVAKLVDR